MIRTDLALIALGTLSLGVEHLFVAGVDSQGVVQESLFLPLGWLALFAGGALATTGVLRRWTRGT